MGVSFRKLSSIDPFYQFVYRQNIHFGEAEPFLAKVLDRCSEMIYYIIYTKETIV